MIKKKIALILWGLLTFYFLLFTLNLFLADVSFNYGERARRYGLDEIAADYYRDAINLNPREPRYHRELASVLVSLDKIAEAEVAAETAYDLNPHNSLTLRSLVSTYSQTHPRRAEELAQEAIDQQPTNPELYYQQALILLQGERYEEAGLSLKKSLELKPDYQKARELLESFPQNRH